MKFSAIRAGKRAIKRIELPNFEQADGTKVFVGLRPLTTGEYFDVVKSAIEYAKAKGSTHPTDGDVLYDTARMAFTLAISAVDVDDEANLFFDTGIDEMIVQVGVQTLVFLYQHQELWQDQCSPFAHKLTTDELAAKVREVAGPDGDMHFIHMPPSMRVSFARSMAAQLLTLLTSKSPSSSSSADSSQSS